MSSAAVAIKAHAYPVDMLGEAIDRVRPLIATGTTKERTRILWAAARAARDLGAHDVVFDSFIRMAVEANLINDRGWWTGADVRESVRPFGKEDVAHCVTWALRGWNPFEEGPLT